MAPAHESDCTARLVQVLVRKGLLSQSEAKEILDEREAERRRVRPLPDAL
jgi:polyhydroxyalkanoate synthesis regulator phasin